MGEWIHRVYIFVPLADMDAANELATRIGPAGEDERKTFGAVRLSPTGAEPATHTACNTAAKQRFVDDLVPAKTQLANLDFKTAGGKATFEDACAERGLRLISVDTEAPPPKAEIRKKP